MNDLASHRRSPRSRRSSPKAATSGAVRTSFGNRRFFPQIHHRSGERCESLWGSRPCVDESRSGQDRKQRRFKFSRAFKGRSSTASMRKGDMILFVAHNEWKKTCASLSAVRSKLGKDLQPIRPGFEFCWIVDFPLFEYNEERDQWEAAHHMFSMPQAVHRYDGRGSGSGEGRFVRPRAQRV